VYPRRVIAIVTGAASGIGRSLARLLVERGHGVVMADVDEPALFAARAELAAHSSKVEAELLDVRDADAWESLVGGAHERHGRVDLLMNVAGCIAVGWSHELDPQAIHRLIDVNVKGVIFGTNAASKRMIPARRGHIVNVASLAGIAPVPGLSVYAASKYAVRGFSLSVAEELRPHGVSVTVVCPGAVETPMLDAQVAHEEAAFTFSAPRALTAEEVSCAIVDRALSRRPVELNLDAPGSGQTAMAKLAGMFPGLMPRVSPWVRKMGERNQRRRRDERDKS
jgi:NAD(P)-dependent dehydrogenase (short-subunit alcohol dehydrogenase family)